MVLCHLIKVHTASLILKQTIFPHTKCEAFPLGYKRRAKSSCIKVTAKVLCVSQFPPAHFIVPLTIDQGSHPPPACLSGNKARAEKQIILLTFASFEKACICHHSFSSRNCDSQCSVGMLFSDVGCMTHTLPESCIMPLFLVITFTTFHLPDEYKESLRFVLSL